MIKLIKKHKVLGAVFGLSLAFLGWLGSEVGLDLAKLWWSERQEANVEQQIKEFGELSLVTMAETSDKGVRFTYYTCNIPVTDYTVNYLVNGKHIKSEGPYNPEAYGAVNKCFTWTGDWHNDTFKVDSGDEVTIRWKFGDYGHADMIIIVK